MEDITSPSREEKDYEIILDKISRLSLKEDLSADRPILDEVRHYYLVLNKIVVITTHIATS